MVPPHRAQHLSALWTFKIHLRPGLHFIGVTAKMLSRLIILVRRKQVEIVSRLDCVCKVGDTVKQSQVPLFCVVTEDLSGVPSTLSFLVRYDFTEKFFDMYARKIEKHVKQFSFCT